MIKTAAMLLLLAGGMSSCIEETFPESSTLTKDQLDNMETAPKGLVNAIVGHLGESNTVYSSSSSYFYNDLGYPGLGMIRDIYCSDFSIYDSSYEYFWYWATNTYLGVNYVPCYLPWRYYYDQISYSHNVLRLPVTDESKAYHGIARFYRAWTYFDMARMYEYKETGVSALDNEASANNIHGLTVPILTENSTEDDARNLPRAPFYEMYRFILDDLDAAEEYLADYSRTAKNMPDLAVIYGEKARVYLELGSRFTRYPEDLTTLASSGVDLGVSSAADCYTKAASYARQAITESGATPLTESEWYGGSSYTDGFNSVNSNAWLLGIIIQKEQLSSYDYNNFIGHVSPEQFFGVGGIDYNATTGAYSNAYMAQRLIGARLYSKIEDDDWRKLTWIDPADAGKAPGGKYKTSVADAHFKVIPAYASFKFRPKSGERSDFSVAAAADYPLMRVEEMYFIEAEAKANLNLSDGINALQSFINGYRYKNGSYKCTATDIKSFREQMMLQKRIEFWGEGIIAWDYKRLDLAVERGYIGTNFPEYYRLNSYEGYCAPWLNAYISTDEVALNQAIINNPDPSDSIIEWTEE